MNAIDQAAEIIAIDHQNRSKGIEWGPYPAAHALADAGLLVTDEIQAVLDAAVALKRLPPGSQDYTDHSIALGVAVRAYLTSRPS